MRSSTVPSTICQMCGSTLFTPLGKNSSHVGSTESVLPSEREKELGSAKGDSPVPGR